MHGTIQTPHSFHKTMQVPPTGPSLESAPQGHAPRFASTETQRFRALFPALQADEANLLPSDPKTNEALKVLGRAMEDDEAPPGDSARLSVRNLLRGYRYRLPTGQAVANLLGVDVLAPDQLRDAADSQAQADALRPEASRNARRCGTTSWPRPPTTAATAWVLSAATSSPRCSWG